MAIWQFDFHFIPSSVVERRFPAARATMTAEEYDAVDWWDGLDVIDEIERSLTALLPRGTSWDSERDTWGDENGDRFDLLREQQRIAEVFGRLDVRNLSVPFLNRVVEMMRRHELLMVTEDRHLLRPSLKALLVAIHGSRAFAYVRDPERFLRQLANLE